MMATIYPVIMAGGTGTRLWPLSRKAKPKQFLPLLSGQTMLEDTLERLSAIKGAEVAAPTVICGEAHEHLVQDIFRHSGRPLKHLVLEPVGRNTAPVAVIAADLVAAEDPDGLILLLPADHHIADPAAFADAVSTGIAAASDGYLTTFGIEPTRPETGYGYIHRGSALANGVYTVDRFVEKPDCQTAEAYLADGHYTWNAGIFLFQAASLLEEASKHAKEITTASREVLASSPRTGNLIRLDAERFAAVPANSIDYAIMEETNRAAVVGPVRMGWNDIGSWHAVRTMTDNGEPDSRTIIKDCKNAYVRSEGPLVAAIGLDNVVIIATGDAVLVVDADRAQEVKDVIDALKAAGREDLL